MGFRRLATARMAQVRASAKCGAVIKKEAGAFLGRPRFFLLCVMHVVLALRARGFFHLGEVVHGAR